MTSMESTGPAQRHAKPQARLDPRPGRPGQEVVLGRLPAARVEEILSVTRPTAHAAIEALVERGVSCVVATCGGDGVLIADALLCYAANVVDYRVCMPKGCDPHATCDADARGGMQNWRDGYVAGVRTKLEANLGIAGAADGNDFRQSFSGHTYKRLRRVCIVEGFHDGFARNPGIHLDKGCCKNAPGERRAYGNEMHVCACACAAVTKSNTRRPPMGSGPRRGRRGQQCAGGAGGC
jgi:hypothetical protein